MDLPPNFDVIQAPETAYCIVSASRRYLLPPESLLTLAMVEGGRTGTQSRNENGSYDLGIMQVNTVWLRKNSPLKGYVTYDDLVNDVCKNVHAAAWILATQLKKAKGDLWKAIGMYHHPSNSRFAQSYKRKVNEKLDLAKSVVGMPIYRHYVDMFFNAKQPDDVRYALR